MTSHAIAQSTTVEVFLVHFPTWISWFFLGIVSKNQRKSLDKFLWQSLAHYRRQTKSTWKSAKMDKEIHAIWKQLFSRQFCRQWVEWNITWWPVNVQLNWWCFLWRDENPGGKGDITNSADMWCLHTDLWFCMWNYWITKRLDQQTMEFNINSPYLVQHGYLHKA